MRSGSLVSILLLALVARVDAQSTEGQDFEARARAFSAASAPTAPTPDDLARAIWVEGRIRVPEGVPPGERIFVTARGRAFTQGSVHRVEASRDGTFRVAFASSTHRGSLSIEAPHLRLEEAFLVDPHEQAGGITLEPVLAACMTGRVLLGPDMRERAPELVRARIELRASTDAFADGPSLGTVLDENLEFAAGGLESGAEYELTFAPRHVIAVHAPFESPVEGATRVMDLPLQAGNVLRGHVVDDAGTPLAGAHLDVALECGRYAFGWLYPDFAVSRSDGSFEIWGFGANTWSLRGCLEGHRTTELDLGELRGTELREGVTLVLDREPDIRGQATWSDGRPFLSAEDASSWSRDFADFPDGCPVRGIVRNVDGSPAADTLVHVDTDDKGSDPAGFELFTNARGAFVAHMPRGAWVSLFARGPDSATLGSTNVRVVPGRAAFVALDLKAATRVYVDVRDRTGHCVNAASIAVLDELARDCSSVSHAGAPDEELDGDMVAVLPPGNYRVVAKLGDGSSAEGCLSLDGRPTAQIRLHASD